MKAETANPIPRGRRRFTDKICLLYNKENRTYDQVLAICPRQWGYHAGVVWDKVTPSMRWRPNCLLDNLCRGEVNADGTTGHGHDDYWRRLARPRPRGGEMTPGPFSTTYNWTSQERGELSTMGVAKGQNCHPAWMVISPLISRDGHAYFDTVVPINGAGIDRCWCWSGSRLNTIRLGRPTEGRRGPPTPLRMSPIRSCGGSWSNI